MRKLIFALGILIAIASGIGWYAVSNMMNTKVPVVYALTDITNQTIINSNQVEVKQVPRNQAPSGAAQSLNEVINKRLNWPLMAGDPIRIDKIESSESVTIPNSNSRLIAFKIDYNGSIAGLAKYGDNVDIVLTINAEKNAGAVGNHKPSTGYILNNLFIEGTADASGRFLTMSNSPDIGSSSNLSSSSIPGQIIAGMVTEIIARVTPKQYLVIRQAESMGTFSLAKRGNKSSDYFPINDAIENSTSIVSADFIFSLLESQGQVSSELVPQQVQGNSTNLVPQVRGGSTKDVIAIP